MSAQANNWPNVPRAKT